MSESAGRRLRGKLRRLRYRGARHEMCVHITGQISLRGITDTSVRDRLATLVLRALPQHISCWDTFFNGLFCSWSADCVLLSQIFFANTRLHVSSSVDMRLNDSPLQPGLRGRGVLVGYICCARFEWLVKT